MNECQFEVKRQYIGDGVERSARTIAKFENLIDAFAWAKFIDKTLNQSKKYKYYLSTLTGVYKVENLPDKFKDWSDYK